MIKLILRSTLLAAVLGVGLMLVNTHAARATCGVTGLGNTSLSLNINETGNHKLWFRIKAPDTTNNALFAQIDGAGCLKIGGDSATPTDAWTWVSSGKAGSTSTPTTYNFATKGAHSVLIVGYMPNTQIDRVIALTASDPCVPSNTNGASKPGDNCLVNAANTTVGSNGTTAGSTSSNSSQTDTTSSTTSPDITAGNPSATTGGQKNTAKTSAPAKLSRTLAWAGLVAAGLVMLAAIILLINVRLRRAVLKRFKRSGATRIASATGRPMTILAASDKGVIIQAPPSELAPNKSVNPLKRPFANNNPILMLIVVISVALSGTSILILVRAATVGSSVEAEAGTLAGTATKQTDASASGGAAVIFKPNTPPPPPPPTVNLAHPFLAASLWNSLTPTGTSWHDTPVIHHLGDGSFRNWWVSYKAAKIWWSSPGDPVWTFNMQSYIAIPWHRNRPATTFTMRAPANLTAPTAAQDSDQILIVADPVSGDYAEVWIAHVDSVHRVITSNGNPPAWARGNMLTGAGFGDLIGNNAGVRASNYSWAAGLITGADLAAGHINHALALGAAPEVIKGGGAPNTPGPYRAPATAGNGTWPTGPVYMGSKLGIPAGVARPNGLSDIGKMVFEALQKYGAYIGDAVGSPSFILYSDYGSIPLPDVQGGPRDHIDYTVFNPLILGQGGSSDMQKIAPLLRVADYQP